jgi:hypothetical protein
VGGAASSLAARAAAGSELWRPLFSCPLYSLGSCANPLPLQPSPWEHIFSCFEYNVFELAREVLNYAAEEFEKAIKLKDILLYRNAADKAFLALVIAISRYIEVKSGVATRSHSERRRALREMGREDLRAIYSDLMETLHEEAFYEGKFDPDEVRYSIEK